MKIITSLFLLLTLGALNAQQFLTPSFSYSHKKLSYLTLTSGDEVQGTIKDLDRQKGLIEEVVLKDGKGKKHKYKAKDIKEMYLPASGMDKLGKALGATFDTQKWTDEKLNADLFQKGYVYFEMIDVKIKKKSEKLLMQLLNPHFSTNIRVYHDPFAKETTGFGVAGVTVVGGLDKSYYVSKGDDAAYRLKKKDYDELYVPMWKSCDELEGYSNKSWSEFEKHVSMYNDCQ